MVFRLLKRFVSVPSPYKYCHSPLPFQHPKTVFELKINPTLLSVSHTQISTSLNSETSSTLTAGEVIKCKAAVAWEAGKPLVIEEVEVAPPQKHEVRLKILFTALCSTDVYFWEAKNPARGEEWLGLAMPALDKGVAVMVAATWSSLRRLGFVKSTTERGQNRCEKKGEQRRSAATVREVAGKVAAATASGCDEDGVAGKVRRRGTNPLFPRIFGHEAGGVVESVGEGVTELEPGDHVLPVFTGECKECLHCKSEERNLCDLLRINTDRGTMLNDGQSRFSMDGKPIYHFVGTSTFSEYTVAHVGSVVKINPAAPLDKVCVLSCGICTALGYGATVNVAKPKKGSSVAIFGLGAVGLAAAEGARVSGAARIIGVDLNSNRFEEAKKFGVNEFVNPKDHNKPVQQVIAEMTNGGVDRSVECTGSIQAMISAFECVHDGWGVAVLVGVPNKDDAFKTHPMNFLNERTLKGTFYGNYKPRTDLPGVVEKYMNKELEVDKFITHSVPFSEINKAFEYMLAGQGIRCIIRMEH